MTINYYSALFILSAAMLSFQVALTRLFALAQGSHLAFMAVSLALLGFGASGTMLSLRPLDQFRLKQTLTGLTLAFSLSLPLVYLSTNYLPFDAYRIAWERIQWLYLILYYLALTLPFFFGGLITGALLAAYPEKAGPVYGANLAGSGLGPLLALPALTWLGGPGTIFFCALLGMLATMLIALSSDTENSVALRTRLLKSWRLQKSSFVLSLISLLFLLAMLKPPALFDIQLTPYKALSQALLYPQSEIIHSDWTASARVDVIQSEGIRSAPGLSFAYPGQIPSQLGLTIDGDNLVPVTQPQSQDADQPSQDSFTAYLPPALGFELRPQAKVLILEPGGGLAVLMALQNGAESVTVIHNNPATARLLLEDLAPFNGQIYTNPKVNLIIDSPRRYLERTSERFDLILLPLSDSYRPVTAGAYTLNESYLYTVEAFTEVMAHLQPQGLFLAERWLQAPPSESLRLWTTLVAAFEQTNKTSLSKASSQPERHLAALRSLQTSLVLASPAPLSDADLTLIRDFAAEKQYDLIWLPDLEPAETNRYSRISGMPYYQRFRETLSSAGRHAFFENYDLEVAPPTDNRPYFFHFFKWTQTPAILRTLGKTWQPFGGSGYLLLVILLVMVFLLSLILILSPLVVFRYHIRSGSPNPDSDLPGLTYTTILVYFTCLGLGFLFVEIPLLQRFIFYLGHPTTAFAVVLSALLLASGLGSLWLSQRLPLTLTLLLIAGLNLLYPWLLPQLFSSSLSQPLGIRAGLTFITLLPLGLLMGIPFPRGLSLIGQIAPHLIPWAWAVNGCASVVSAILAAMVSLTWGFNAVLWGAALAYGLAALVIRSLK